jgi:trans-2,3-dihydro-3-hydroxyanthranilate isomerase
MAKVTYHTVDVFTEAPFSGNPLAVFPNASEVADEWMPRIARELNLSETAFVTARRGDSYDIRIFTPASELPFAGHPTIGTAWVLHKLQHLRSQRVIQHSAGGLTPVSITNGCVWFERTGSVGDAAIDPKPIAHALGVDSELIRNRPWNLDGRMFRAGPAFADAGLKQLMVPVVSPETLVRLKPSDEIFSLAPHGLYCWTVLSYRLIKARFFAPGIGVLEDPATGSAAASLGIYVASRVGEAKFAISQGAEVGRPSRILVEASRDSVKVGGAVVAVGTGTIDLPGS